jgi:hypothetical protein
VEDIDSMMLDEIEMQEQAEIDAMLQALPTEPSNTSHDNKGDFALFSDDFDYDDLFIELASSEQQRQPGPPGEDMDMS